MIRPDNLVIPRAKPVGISWHCVGFRTFHQEIATPLRARNDSGDQEMVILNIHLQFVPQFERFVPEMLRGRIFMIP